MKKLLVALVIFASANLSAQSSFNDDVAIVQSLYGKSKAELVKDFMGLSDAQTTAFQKLYDDYEVARKALGQKKIQIINDYAANYATLTDVKADELTKENLKNNVDMEKLHASTYNKAKKAIGAINAAKFIQLETYLQTAIRYEIQDSIPFIGEMEKVKVQQ